MASEYGQQDYHSFLTKADLKDSLNTLNSLLTTTKTYRAALISLANATAAFAKSLEDCARLKGTQAIFQEQQHQQEQLESTSDSVNSSPFTPHSSQHDHIPAQNSNPAEKLLAASGLHFLTANLEQVLSDTFKNSFELPLLNLYESYRQQLAQQQNRYESLLSIKTKAIRETELKNMNQGGSRHSRHTPRDLDSFRRGLKELQDQVEQVESLKQSYYLQVANGERQVWNKVAENISLVVKSEVEVYDRIASKPISDPTLEAMVTSIPDPFDAFKPVGTMSRSASGTGPEIYSILDPLSSLFLGSPQKTRRSVDLNQSLASLRHDFRSPSPDGSLTHAHPHLNPAPHWAESVAERTIQPELLPPFLDHPDQPQPTRSSSPTIANNHIDTPELKSPSPLRNVCSLLSTDSACTATLPNTALTDPSTPHISPGSSSQTTADTTVILSKQSESQKPAHDKNTPTNGSALDPSIPHSSSLTQPPPNMHRLSTATSIQPHIDEVDSLLGEPPPTGLDLSDSDI